MTERLARSAGLIGVATLTSRMLGLVRDMVLARLFGASLPTDAFYVATRVPNLVRDLFAEGAMSAAFVPTFTRHLKSEGREAAWRLGNQVINALLLVTGVIVVLGVVFAVPLVRLLADDATYVEGGEAFALTTQLTRITMPFLTLLALAAAMAGMLNSLRRFFVPALSPATYNVAVIASAFAIVPFCPTLGLPPIAGIAIGGLLGGLAQIAIMLPTLRSEGYRYQAVLDPTDPGLRQILILMGPGTIGVAAAQINLLVNTSLATGQGEGAVTWLTYAFRLMYLPIGLFGVSIATAAIPDIARQAAGHALVEIRRTISSSLRLMLMLSVPSTVGLVVLAGPIVELLFQGNAFTSEDTWQTAVALICYAPGLIGYSVVKIASPTFYALRDARTPVIVSLITIGVNLALNLALVNHMGYRGLALGTALAAIVNASLLLWLLSKRLGGLEGRRVTITLIKIAAASVVMGAVAFVAEAWLDAALDSPTMWARAIRVSGGMLAGLVALAGAAVALRLDEFNQAWQRVAARLR